MLKSGSIAGLLILSYVKRPMKRTFIIAFLFAATIALSCKKAIEDAKKGMALDIMTSGQWHVKSYTADSLDHTARFEPYTFKFNKNGTVEAINASSPSKGTWFANMSRYAITSQFPGAGDPLRLLNGTWLLKDSDEHFVAAELDSSQAKTRLRLEKVP